MTQYCRHCAFCFEGDGYYCSDKNICLSEKQIRRANTCKDFALSELGDVVTGKAYRPRERKIITKEERQLSIFDVMA